MGAILKIPSRVNENTILETYESEGHCRSPGVHSSGELAAVQMILSYLLLLDEFGQAPSVFLVHLMYPGTCKIRDVIPTKGTGFGTHHSGLSQSALPLKNLC